MSFENPNDNKPHLFKFKNKTAKGLTNGFMGTN